MGYGLTYRQYYMRAYRWIRKKNNPFINTIKRYLGKPQIRGIKAIWKTKHGVFELWLDCYWSIGACVLYPKFIKANPYTVLHGFRHIPIIPKVAMEYLEDNLKDIVLKEVD